MFILILFVKMKPKGLLPSSTCKKCRLQIANVSFEGFFCSCTDKTCLFIWKLKLKLLLHISHLNCSSSSWTYLRSHYKIVKTLFVSTKHHVNDFFSSCTEAIWHVKLNSLACQSFYTGMCIYVLICINFLQLNRSKSTHVNYLQ